MLMLKSMGVRTMTRKGGLADTPGPGTLLSKGYASLFQKTLRKGLFLCFLYVLDLGKKGPFFLKNVSSFGKKGSFLRHFHWKKLFSGGSSQHFLIKGVLFSSGNISERGNLENDHTPFTCETRLTPWRISASPAAKKFPHAIH